MKQVIAAVEAPPAIGPYSQAVQTGGLVFTAGQIALNPASGEVEGDVREQAGTVMTNIGHILRAAGVGYSNIVKTTIFLVDLDDFAAVNEVYGCFFDSEPPARSAVQVAGLPKGALVEIEAVASVG